MFGCSTELCSAYGLVHCSRKATSNPGSRKIPAFSIMYVNILPRPASWSVHKMAEEGRDRKRFKSRDEEGQTEDGEKASKSAKAIRLLREVTTLLTESVDVDEAKETREVPKPVGSSTPSSNAILSEFRSIFAPYKQVSPVPLMSTFQQPKNRPSKQKQRGVFFQPKETWTHEFFCLAQKGQERVPTKSDKFELQAAGLGRKKICFHSKAKFVITQGVTGRTFPTVMKHILYDKCDNARDCRPHVSYLIYLGSD